MPITKVFGLEPEDPHGKRLYVIPNGTTFTGIVGSFAGLFFKTGAGVVQLRSGPDSNSWGLADKVTVIHYRPVNCHIHIEGEGFNDGDAEERTKRIL